jgi:hypothetical protein
MVLTGEAGHESFALGKIDVGVLPCTSEKSPGEKKATTRQVQLQIWGRKNAVLRRGREWL